MKQTVYIVAFGFFGLLVATLLHAGIEVVALQTIFGNPDTFSDTTWWQNWDLLHQLGGSILWIAGLLIGVYLGVVCWKPYGSKPGFHHWKRK